MKNNYFLLLLFLLPFTKSYSQGLSFGPEAGLNIIWLSEDYTGHSYGLGWHFGGFAEYQLNDFVSIRSGVYYTEKKQQYEINEVSVNPLLSFLGIGEIDQLDLNTYTNTSGRVTQNYFEIPLLAKLNYKGLSVLAGLQSSFMFRSTTKETATERTPIFSIISSELLGGFAGFLPPAESISETTSQSGNSLRSFDWGAKFGLAYKIDRVELSTSFYLGLIDYTTNTSIARTHQYYQTTLCYHFGSNSGNGNFWQSRKLK